MKRFLFFLATAVVFALAVVLLLRLDLEAASTDVQVTTTPLPAETIFPEEMSISKYQALLEEGNLDAQMQASIAEKLEIAERIESQREASIESGQLGSAQGIEGFQSQQDPDFQSGIFEGGEGMFHSQEAVIQNHWQAQVGNQYIQVFAGVSGTDSSQGVVYVVTTSEDRMMTEITRYETAEGLGMVRVEAEMNDFKLLLSSESGETFLFDVLSRSFE